MTTPRLCALVFVMCAAPRVAVLLRTPPPKPNYYWEIATSLLASGTYAMGSGVTTAIEPLYPFFLAAARFVTGDRFALAMLLQIVVASCGGILLLLLTQHLTGSRTAAVAAAVLYAFYPYYVRQSIAPHELTLSIVLLVHGRVDLLQNGEYQTGGAVRRVAGAAPAAAFRVRATVDRRDGARRRASLRPRGRDRSVGPAASGRALGAPHARR